MVWTLPASPLLLPGSSCVGCHLLMEVLYMNMHGRLFPLFVLFCSVTLFSMHEAEARDPSPLKACEVVTGKDVAGMAKGKLMSSPLGEAQACAYLVEMADGTVESYRFSIQAPIGIEAMWKSQTAAERGETVAGLWDEAHVAKQFMASGLSLTAVKRSDLAIELTGERKDVLLAIAKLAVSRLR